MRGPEPHDGSRTALAGGVSSTLRTATADLTFGAAHGAHVELTDGRRLCDYHGAFGAVVLGHRDERVDAAVARTMATIDLVGAGVTPIELEAAETVCAALPAADLVTFLNSGSEATFAAARLARAATGRTKLVKFQGSYHGWHDSVMLNVATPRERMGRPDPLSAGLRQCELDNTIVCTFNDLGSVEAALRTGEVACILVEPIQHNIGAVLPAPGFLQGVRELATRFGAVLVFDEVITGVRHALGGYQSVCDVPPDLTCLGKAIANGYPVAALAGTEALMSQLVAAGGDVYVGGTFNGHPASMAALCATFDALAAGDAHARMFALGDVVRDGLQSIARSHGFAATTCGFGGVFVLYFVDRAPRDYADLLDNDADLSLSFRRRMIARGHFLYPMELRRGSISAAHTAGDVDRLLTDADVILGELARQGAEPASATPRSTGGVE